MLGSSVLDVAVGMMFMYLLFGILVTAINESISSLLNKRGRSLLEGIKNLLNDPNYTGLAHQIYNHGLIDGISQNASNDKKANRLPSYLPSSSFSLALVDILTTRGALAAAHSSLLVAVEQADDTVYAMLQIKNPNAEQSAALLAAQTAQAQAEAALQTSWQQAKTQLSDLQQNLQPNDELAKSQLICAQQQFDLCDAAIKMLAARRAAMQSASNPKKLEQVKLAANAAENALAVGRSLLGSQQDPLAKIEQAIAQLPNGHTKESLYVLLDKTRRELTEGEHAIETLRKNLENWFNESMDRVSGWYKRWSQKIGLMLATVLVVVCNFDSLQLAQRLMNDGALRTALANTATDFARDVSNAEPIPPGAATAATAATPSAMATSAEATEATQAAPQNQISADARKKMLDLVGKDMNLPIGWNLEKDFDFLKPPSATNATVSADKNVAASGNKATTTPLTFTEWMWKILAKALGLGISIFAVSLGAPFWFDFLMKFVNMRSTGKRPATDVK